MGRCSRHDSSALRMVFTHPPFALASGARGHASVYGRGAAEAKAAEGAGTYESGMSDTKARQLTQTIRALYKWLTEFTKV
jgi:hypothetical protein